MYSHISNLSRTFLVGIYIRLSKEDDNLGESESIQNQKTLLTKYVKTQGLTLVDIYIDDGFTGTNFKRPAFQRMLNDIEAGKINMVITKDLSRLSRDYIGTGEYVEKWFPAHNVRYVALTDAIDTFQSSANNDIAPFKAILNDMYAKDLSKKIRTALHTMQSEGKWVGACPPFGYKIDSNNKNHLVPDEYESQIVKRIFSMFVEGYKINQICNKLNDDQVPTFSLTRNRNNQYTTWSNATIKKILQNQLYTGDMVQNRRCRVSYKYRKIVCNPENEWIIKENMHEALVDKKTFLLVQQLLPKQHQRNDKKEYFLLDGLLKCADCGHNIGIRARRSNGKATTVCNYYRKFKTAENVCTNHGFDYDSIEKGVIVEIKKAMKFLKPEDILNKINVLYQEDPYENIKNKIGKLEGEIEKLKNSLDNMYIDKLLNKISEDMFTRIKLRIIKDIELKENNLIETSIYLENKEKSRESRENEIEILVKDYLNGEYLTRDLLLRLITNVSIHENGNIDIQFNFKELI
jgi:DNA invertase Pin-like site-specific DNA recombinase